MDLAADEFELENVESRERRSVFCNGFRGCAIENGQRRIRRALDGARVCYVPQERLVRYDPELRSFFNINQPADLARLRSILSEKV